MLNKLHRRILLINTSPYIYISMGICGVVEDIRELVVGHGEHDAAGGGAAPAGRPGTCRVRRARGECREALGTEAAAT